MMPQRTERNRIMSVSMQENVAFGKPLPRDEGVTNILQNVYGEQEHSIQQERYSAWMKQRSTSKGAMPIRMTNAQIAADNAIRNKSQIAEPRSQFKLKRFQNVEPKTSTSRAAQGYMVS